MQQAIKSKLGHDRNYSFQLGKWKNENEFQSNEGSLIGAFLGIDVSTLQAKEALSSDAATRTRTQHCGGMARVVSAPWLVVVPTECSS